VSGPGDSQNCLNCGAELVGQYCGQCGQRATNRLISIFELLRDAFGDLFELDSRLWRTLLPLLIRPGLLTKDYLEGRRARYMPPFRMYLVLSVVFFVVAFFNPKDEFAILYEPVAESATEALEEDPASADEESSEYEDKYKYEYEDEDADDPGINITFDDEDDESVNITFDEETGMLGTCTLGEYDMGDSPEWLKRRMTPERLKNVCERLNAAGMKGLQSAILGNIPAALIILLPLMAFVLKLLYPLSRRYYVEHLLFFVHFHAFFFLILSLLVLLDRLGDWIAILETPTTLIIVAAALYIPIYLFISMRTVYGQGRAVTFLKYVPLTISYLIGFTLVMVGATLIAVFSI
jgi:Protein of unknown function (DUF3667)